MATAKQTRTFPPEYTVQDGENTAVFSGPEAKARAESYASPAQSPAKPVPKSTPEASA